MTQAVKNFIDLSAARQTLTNFASNRVTWIRAHQKLAGSSAVAVVAFAIAYYVWKNTPQKPDVEMKSTLNRAVLSIKIPNEKHAPPSVTLTFCIDLSGSMQKESRGDEVKKALNTLLDDAQKKVKVGAKISIAITGFTETSKVITPLTKLTSSNEVVQKVKNQIQQLEFNGNTEIFSGLEGAIEQLKDVAKANKKASHTLVLLTDGEVNIDNPTRLKQIHSNLVSTNAKLFAVGIGKEHHKDTLKQITTYKARNFSGTYIDTTSGSSTIESAIASIYKQALSSFQEVELVAPQLRPGTWSVNGTIIEKQSKINFGPLSEGETLKKVIEIQGEKLTAPLDLSNLVFTLTFKDPKGRQGKLLLPWNPNTIIDPAILLATTS